MGEVIRWHDDDRLAKHWATEAKYRQMVANGLIPPPVEMPSDVAPSEYVAPPSDSA